MLRGKRRAVLLRELAAYDVGLVTLAEWIASAANKDADRRKRRNRKHHKKHGARNNGNGGGDKGGGMPNTCTTNGKACQQNSDCVPAHHAQGPGQPM
ncbi:MAG: hypothetical protein M3Z20_18935 [Chloroflexota bacterium]|nr:hypothetical protein [Chloroflexota bacterium]